MPPSDHIHKPSVFPKFEFPPPRRQTSAKARKFSPLSSLMRNHCLSGLLILASLITLVHTTTTLRDLVDSAQSGATIVLQPVIYSGPANCELVINKSISLVSVSGQTILDCLGASRCVRVTGGASVTIVGLRLRNGNAMGSSSGGSSKARAQQAADAVRHTREGRRKVSIFFFFRPLVSCSLD